MSLRTGELRALRKIETDLCRTDPWLQARFAMFAKLTPDTATHGPEYLGPARERRGGRHRARPRMGRLTTPARLRLILFISVAVLTVTCAVFLGGDPGATQCRPAPPQPASGIAKAWPVPMGHRFAVTGSPVAAAPRYGEACAGGGSQASQPPITQP